MALALPRFWQHASEPEYIRAGDEVAVVCSDFPEKVVKGFVVRWAADPASDWALIHIWVWDEWAKSGEGEYRPLQTWESLDNFRRLDCFLGEGRKLDKAVIEKVEAEAFAAAS